MIDPVIDVVARAAFALLFLVAAIHKLRDPARFAAMLGEYRVLPARLVRLGAVVVVGAELVAAMALAAPGWRHAGLVAAAVLLLVYAAAIGVNLLRGRRDIDCGCAGPAARRPIGAGLVVRNLVLAVLALLALAPVGARPLVWVDGVTVLGATAGLAALYAALDRMLADAPALARVRGGA
jgi:hypothetical protein